MSGPDHDHLARMLSRLKLTAIRDQLDSLLDEAAHRELSLRETQTVVLVRELLAGSLDLLILALPLNEAEIDAVT